MREIETLLDEIYTGQERVSRDEIHRRAVAHDLPAEVVNELDGLPEGEYAEDEIGEALAQLGDPDGALAGEPVRVRTDPPLSEPDLGEPDFGEPDLDIHPDDPATGIPATDLADADLLRELYRLHDTRHGTLRHASDEALERHSTRTAELEGEYLLRYPGREVDPQRLRAGARTRRDSTDPQARTGAEQPWQPEDLAVAQGHDPSAGNVANAARQLDQEGSSAIEKTVP